MVPVVQTINLLLSKVVALEEHALASSKIPESFTRELQRVSAESTAVKESVRLHQNRVEHSLCDQNVLLNSQSQLIERSLANQSKLISTQAEL